MARKWTATFAILALAALIMGGCGSPDRPVQQSAAPAADALPAVGLDGTPGGMSPDGGWLALQAAPTQQAGKMQSQLVVLDTTFKKPPTQVTLDGDFWFDAISNNGNALYLLEYTSAGA